MSHTLTQTHVLGVNGGHKSAEDDDLFGFSLHDAAAVLLRDGRIVSAIEEERLNRIKHSNCFPVNAIKSVLKCGGVRLEDIDAVAMNNEAWIYEYGALREALENPASPLPTAGPALVAELFDHHFAVDIRPKLRFCHHHYSHAWSTYALSGFATPLILTIDGVGDGCSGMVFHGENGKLRQLRKIGVDRSLGVLYLSIIKLIGFGQFEEYKAMGLAPYGDPKRYGDLMREGCRLLPDGHYEIDRQSAWIERFTKAGLISQARRKGEVFSQIHMDIAAALQETVEDVVLHVLRYFAKETGLRELCLAGGVAHNCSLNGKILYAEMFDHVFVQPASHDAGGALGAALSVAFENTPLVHEGMSHVYLGRGVGTGAQIDEFLGEWSAFLLIEKSSDVVAATAKLLADGAVIGWMQGRSEFGPRALGNRSILSDPRPAANKERINRMVKKREAYRPFAPSIVEEEICTFIDTPKTKASLSFMTFVLKVREGMRERLAAVTHIDGSARVQTVSRDSNPKYWDLLKAFGGITGIPVLLNTSFNNFAEPIVDSLNDAITCFLTTELDYLVVGDFIVRRRMPIIENLSAANLVISLPPQFTLEKAWLLNKACRERTSSFAIVSVKRSLYETKRVEISQNMFRLLSATDGDHTINELIGDDEPEATELRRAMITEAVSLWSDRMIRMTLRSRVSDLEI